MDFTKLQKTVGGIFGLMTCIPGASDALGLTNQQIMAFCDATPDGEDLWIQFRTRRDSKETPDNYDFKSFMIEVLAKTHTPSSRRKTATATQRETPRNQRGV